MILHKCPTCSLPTFLPHRDQIDCLRAWFESVYRETDALLIKMGIHEMAKTASPWPDAEQFQRRTILAHAKLQQLELTYSVYQPIYTEIVRVLHQADLPVPDSDDFDLLSHIDIVVRRPQEEEVEN